MLKPEYWPDDAKWVLPTFLMSDEGKARPDATPRFILAVTGNAGWTDRMWPVILEVTETKA